MSLLLENGADAVSAELRGEDSCDSLLHDAVTNECVSSVELLLHHGAPVNVAGRTVPNTALGQATATRSIDIVRLLLQAGASSNIGVYFGESYRKYSHLLQFAVRVDWDGTLTKAVVDYATDLDLAISSFGPEYNPLIQVIWKGNYDLVQSVVERDDTGPALRNYVENYALCPPDMKKFLKEKYGFRAVEQGWWSERKRLARKVSRFPSLFGSIRS